MFLLPFKALNFAVQHITEILERRLFISSITTCLLLAVDDLQSLKQLVLHLQDVLVVFEVLETNTVVDFEELLETVLLSFVLFLQLVVLLSQSAILLFQVLIDRSDLQDLLLLLPYLLLYLGLVLLLFLIQLLYKLLCVFFRLVYEVAVFDLQILASFEEVSSILLDLFIVLVFQLDQLFFMLLMQVFYLLLQVLISLFLISYLGFIVSQNPLKLLLIFLSFLF